MATVAPLSDAAIDWLDLFGPDGALARRLPGWRWRAGQAELAETVARAIERRAVLFAEAGTGTGKTFAYLAPALLSGRRVVLSTGTRHLQDQLYARDLPLLCAALGIAPRMALLKGRNNYLCRLRLAATQPGFTSAELSGQLRRVERWAMATASGDIAESGLPEDAPVWPGVTSTADNCLGSQCPEFTGCHVRQARRRAFDADVVVVNHHLLCADLALKQDGFGELLPSADAYIIDEAQQFPDTAVGFFGHRLSARQCLELADDSQRAAEAEAPELATAAAIATGAVEHAVATLRAELPAQRGVWEEWIEHTAAAVERVQQLAAALDELASRLSPASAAAVNISRCRERALDLAARAQGFAGAPAAGWYAWYETRGAGFALSRVPLDAGQTLAATLAARQAAWVFTSATLTVADDFAYFSRRLGIAAEHRLSLPSPYDYARQALLYLPPDLPTPDAPGYTAAVVAAARPVLAASGGRAFMLFTSLRALREAAALLADSGFALLVQGSAPRTELLARFRTTPGAVLLGSASFWEGVDVRGPDLSCVIIDKLPFPPPDDPLTQARARALLATDGRPFWDDQLPQAVLTLKQGVGRLIRDADDRGVLMLCDPRLVMRSYGELFLRSLPPMPQTRRIAEVEQFFCDG